VLGRFDDELDRFVKVMPHDYKRALAELEEHEPELTPAAAAGA
jgi:glutamate synthase domain-containing protein 3